MLHQIHNETVVSIDFVSYIKEHLGICFLYLLGLVLFCVEQEIYKCSGPFMEKDF